jgi:hypothetical protein
MDLLKVDPSKEFHFGITFDGTNLVFALNCVGATGSVNLTVKENIDQGIDVIVNKIVAAHPAWAWLKSGASFIEAALGMIK